ncbi:hypothetical protein [Phenylobacterium sp.]|uniref:hypothetical protein n=1 Tax=Phenylobacterium sp. TaxID=1871053 RepID=UPI0035B21B5D
MNRPLDTARRAVRARIARSLARCRRALARRPAAPVAAAPEGRPFVFPHPRTLYRQELQRLEREQFPMWRPDPARVRALQSQGA